MNKQQDAPNMQKEKKKKTALQLKKIMQRKRKKTTQRISKQFEVIIIFPFNNLNFSFWSAGECH